MLREGRQSASLRQDNNVVTMSCLHSLCDASNLDIGSTFVSCLLDTDTTQSSSHLLSDSGSHLFELDQQRVLGQGPDRRGKSLRLGCSSKSDGKSVTSKRAGRLRHQRSAP